MKIACLILAALIGLSCQATPAALTARERPTPVTVPPPGPSLLPPWPVPNPPAFGKRQLYVTTSPADAEVFIDKRFYGLTPLTLPDFPFGSYYLELRKNGYQEFTGWIDYSDRQWAFFYELGRETGFLNLRVSPPEAVLRTVSQPLQPGRNELPAGRYTVFASAFGYQPKSLETTVTAGDETALVIELAPAEFAFSGLSLSRPLFNPRRSGPASSVSLRFTVTGPGDGSLTVADATGREIARLAISRFSVADQSFQWNGLTDKGETAPDGSYTFILRGRGDGAARPIEAHAVCTLDSSFSLDHLNQWSGSAGLFYAPSPATLAWGNLEVNAAALADVRFTEAVSVPVALGARVGLGGGHEVSAGLAALLTGTGPPALIPSAAYKWRFLSSPGPINLAAALQAKISYQVNYQSNFFTNATGISAGVPLRLGLGPFALFLSPEFIVALYKIEPNPAAGAYTWFYGRAGISFDAGFFTLGASVSLRTRALDEGFSIAWPIASSLEASIYLPDSPVYLTAAAVLEWDPGAVRVWAGFGFGLLW